MRNFILLVFLLTFLLLTLYFGPDIQLGPTNVATDSQTEVVW